MEEILEGYPTLNKEEIAIAQLSMRAFPRRGRPNRRPGQGKRHGQDIDLFGRIAMIRQSKQQPVTG